MSIRTYRWNQTPLVGPRSLVISQLHTCEGTSARSSGLTLAGWVTWARRSRVCPAAAAIRYMLDREHQYRPSSSSRTHTCPIERSALPTVFSTPRTAARSAGLNAWVGALRWDCGIGGGGGPGGGRRGGRGGGGAP